MSIATLPPIDAELSSLLKRLLHSFERQDEAEFERCAVAAGAGLPATPVTFVGALCLGGAAFAARIVAHADRQLSAQACYEVLLDAFCIAVEPPPQPPEDHETRVARWLIDGFGLAASAQSLLDILRVELLITAGPLDELPEAVLAGMRHAQWALALRGLIRLKDSLREQTPHDAYGMAAICLHKLGRYEEAEDWVRQGLGPQQALLAVPPIRSEAELMQQWGGNATPVISIVCTTYNHERYIENTLRGFVGQRCDFPFEILIHDDASTDRTPQIIREWQQRYPNLIKPLLQTENQYSKGVRPFELLLARARGDYIATCEGDDFWVEPGKLQRQVGFLKTHPEFSCSAHNYLHFVESAVQVRPWTRLGRDFVLTEQQMMGVHFLVWFPTLVFRRSFSALPPERDLAAFGDQFLTSYLGTKGRCMYFETMLGAVRRENEFSAWSPLPQAEKERRRVQTWAAIASLHRRLGNRQAVADLMAKIAASTLGDDAKAAVLAAAAAGEPTLARAAA